MITPEQKTEIRRLFFAEHHTVNAIAMAQGVHRETVERAINKESFVTRSTVIRQRGIDPFLPMVRDVFDRVPTIRATRLQQMLKERGFCGGVAQIRQALRELRSSQSRRVYLRSAVFPGEQGQCDWAHFGTMDVGKAKRKLSCFVMVLSHSRQLYAVFTFDQTLESFLRGHVAAFNAFEGVPRVILYDNLKAAVIERIGRAIRFNPALLELAGHYHFRPEPCNVARGNEKGRVERAIGYLRTSFFPGRHFKDLPDANRQLAHWLATTANIRPWPGDRGHTVAEVYTEEKGKLLPLPAHPANCQHVRSVRSDKTAYVRFDLNDYSIPPEFCRKALTLMASDVEVKILDGQTELSRHPRSYDRGECIDAQAHTEAIIAARLAAMPSRRRETLIVMIPKAAELLEMLVVRGEALHGHLRRLYDLIEQYGQQAVAAAISNAVERGTPRSETVAHLLHKEEVKRHVLPTLPVQLPNRPGVRDLVVKSHCLELYDELKTTTHPREKENHV
jgi:transposase